MSSTQQPSKVDDTLARWLQSDDSQPREMIVEANLPKRTIGIRSTGLASPRMTDMDNADVKERGRSLGKLQDYLSDLIGGPSVLLSAAGAVAIRATRDQLEQMLTNPMVKMVRPNRVLK